MKLNPFYILSSRAQVLLLLAHKLLLLLELECFLLLSGFLSKLIDCLLHPSHNYPWIRPPLGVFSLLITGH
jgi:hypothetical protein